MNAVVTGITGFAGSHLAGHLLDCGDRVLGLSRQSTWPADAPEALREIPLWAWEFPAESPAPAAVEALAQFQPDCIFHLAGMSLPKHCGTKQPTSAALAVNVEGTAQVARLAGRLKPRPLVLFTSSAKVYGRAERPPWRVAESAEPRPASGYAKSKLYAERRLAEVAAELDIPWIVTRSFQHAGARQPAELMLPQWAYQCALRKPEVVVHNRTTLLDLTDVSDVVAAYRQLACHGQRGATYNVGSGTAQCSGDILHALMQAGDWWPEIRETAPGERHEWIADNCRLRQLTQWSPRVPLVQTIHRVLESCFRNTVS